MSAHSTMQKYKATIRYLAVGVTSLAVDYGLLLTLYHAAHLPLIAATTISFLLGLCVNFLLNKYWTFDAPRGAKHSSRQAALYALLVGINLVCTNLFILYMKKTHIGPEVSKPIATALLTAINYVLYQKVIFRTTPPISVEEEIERSML